MTSRKGSDITRISFNCSGCDTIIDGELVQCNLCRKTFHVKKECSNITATIAKSVLLSDNVSYLCNQCKSVSFCDLFDRFSAIEKELASLREQLKSKTTLDIGEVVFKAIDEYAMRSEKKNNVIIFGLPEPPADSSVEDGDGPLEDVLCAVDVSNDCVESISRIGFKRKDSGKNRPLKLRFRNNEDKQKCLRNARKLNEHRMFQKVFIRPDLTHAQLEHRKLLHEELKIRQNAGEKVMIRNGRIIQQGQPPQ